MKQFACALTLLILGDVFYSVLNDHLAGIFLICCAANYMWQDRNNE